MCLAGCPLNNGSSGTTLHTVTSYHVPESVTQDSHFKVQVTLLPAPATLTSPQSAGSGSAQYQGMRYVSVVDTSSSVPQIQCGGAQPVTVGGSPVEFDCASSSAVLGANNVHVLQIRAPQTADPVDHAYVEVVSQGTVNDQVTDSSGNRINSVSPGQSLLVAFDASAQQAAQGQYTVTAPDGWTVAGSDTCTFPATNSTCSVELHVPADAPMGLTEYVHIASQSGSSRLEYNYFPIEVVPPVSNALLAGPQDALRFEYSENIARTLYANLPGSSPTFTYNPVFAFKNTSSNSIDIASVSVSGLTSVKYTCNPATSSTSCTVNPNAAYTVFGTLPSTFNTLPGKDSVVSISIKDSGGHTYAKSQKVTFVSYVPGTVAVKVIDLYQQLPLRVGAFAGTQWIQFASQNGHEVGKLGGTSFHFKTQAYSMSKDGGVFYLPYAQSAKVYIARGRNGFSYEATPNISALPLEPAYIVLEESYTSKAPQGDSCLNPCDILAADMSYVNSVQISAKFNIMGNAGKSAGPSLPLVTENFSAGVIGNFHTSDFLKAVRDGLTQGKPDWPGLIIRAPSQATVTAAVGGVRAPLSVYGVATQSSGGKNYVVNPFPKDYYDEYIGKIWDYYKTHTMYVFASGTADKSLNIRPANNCVLQGGVVKNSAGDYVLKFKADPNYGACPALGYSKAGLPNQNGPDSCGVTKSSPPAAGTDPCADSPNLVFTKFNACDFFVATGSGQCHPLYDPLAKKKLPVDAATFPQNTGLWGPNGTYRAVVGRAIASYQAAGLLPPPSSLAKPQPTCAPNAMTILRKENAAADVGVALKNYNGLRSSPCVSLSTPIPTFNVYASALLPYVNVYTYSYSDFLGRDSTVTFSEVPLYANGDTSLPRAQPITVILQ